MRILDIQKILMAETVELGILAEIALDKRKNAQNLLKSYYKRQEKIKLQQEKQEEERRLRKQIRAELEEQLRAQSGVTRYLPYWLRGKKGILGISLVIFVMIVLLGCGYLIARIAS